MIRLGLRALFVEHDDLELVGEVESSAEALSVAKAEAPDVVVMDISLNHSCGLNLIENLKLECPDTRVLVYTMLEERIYAERVLRAGALGYVMKRDPAARLLEGIRRVARNKLYLQEELMHSLLDAYVGNGGPAANHAVGLDRLSDRELQVFENIGYGLSTSQIAKKFNLSPKTIDTYRSNIKSKLGLKTMHELVLASVSMAENGSPNGTTPASLARNS